MMSIFSEKILPLSLPSRRNVSRKRSSPVISVPESMKPFRLSPLRPLMLTMRSSPSGRLLDPSATGSYQPLEQPIQLGLAGKRNLEDTAAGAAPNFHTSAEALAEALFRGLGIGVLLFPGLGGRRWVRGTRQRHAPL